MVCENDLTGQAEPDSGAFCFGREEGEKDILPERGRHSRPVVADFDARPSAPGAGENKRYGRRRGMGRRSFGAVSKQVEQNLEEQIRPHRARGSGGRPAPQDQLPKQRRSPGTWLRKKARTHRTEASL